MRITRISYRTNVQVEPYVHRHVEAEATVDRGEKPEAALEKLKAWVDGQLFETEIRTIKRPRRA